MGKKKDKAPKLSAKELRKLAEKAERQAAKKAAAKAEKKAQAKADAKRAEMAKATKKGKSKGADRPTESAVTTESGVVESSAEKKRAEKVSPETGKTRPEVIAERAAEREKTTAEIDEAIKKRLAEKSARRQERVAVGESSILPEEPGSPERLAEMQAKADPTKGVTLHAVIDGEVTIPEGVEKVTVKATKKAKKQVAEVAAEREADATIVAGGGSDDDMQSDAVRAEVEAEEFARPSEAPRDDFETNGLNQYKIIDPETGKERGYTRVTTYIACLEDTKALTEWKMRILMEGVAAAETDALKDRDALPHSVVAKVNDLIHTRDVTIARARKLDRKGKLQLGELATYVNGAMSEFKKSLNKLADEVFEYGGGREAATKGTDIHALCDLHDSEGMDAVQDKLDAGEITPADFADVEAYARAVKALGLKIVASEQTVVNDDLKVAGRLDRIVLGKLPELRDPKTGEVTRPADARARRYVLDIKTGRIDYGQGKIAQQIRLYAESNTYDLNTGERGSHGANRTTGLVLHLPAGSGRASVHVVDLAIGGVGNKLAGEVRAFRNLGKRAIDGRVDLLTIDTDNAEESAA